jgi:hypothetical protein
MHEGGVRAVTVVGEFQEDAFKRVIGFYLRSLN